MNDHDQTTRSERSRSFTEEMQQAFVEWVNKLPFIKKDVARHPEREQLEEESAEQASAPHLANFPLTGRSANDKDHK